MGVSWSESCIGRVPRRLTSLPPTPDPVACMIACCCALQFPRFHLLTGVSPHKSELLLQYYDYAFSWRQEPLHQYTNGLCARLLRDFARALLYTWNTEDTPAALLANIRIELLLFQTTEILGDHAGTVRFI